MSIEAVPADADTSTVDLIDVYKRQVLGIAILLVQKEYDLGESVVFATATAIGFSLALVLFAGLRERLEMEDIPAAMKGMPIALLTAGILAMAFMGFSGLVR